MVKYAFFILLKERSKYFVLRLITAMICVFSLLFEFLNMKTIFNYILMKASKTLHGFYFVQRDYGRRLKDIEILTSTNNLDWENLGQFQLQDHNGGQSIILQTDKLAQYFKIVIKSNHDSGGANACLSELGAF